MNNSEENSAKWIKAVMVVLGELALGLFIFYSYPFVSMIFLGEGAGSLLYSDGNAVAWAITPILLPTSINLRYIYYSLKNKDQDRLKVFKLIQLILVSLYIPFVLWRYFIFGFHI